jgi:hypothetical protein
MNAFGTEEVGRPAAAGAGAGSEEKDEAAARALLTLQRATEMAVAAGIDLDRFMSAACSAYLQSNPELREQIESMQFLAEMEKLRRSGKVGIA